VKVREIIVAHREIIPLLRDIATLKKQTWRNCFERLERPFMEYYKIIADFKEEIHNLYEKASAQSERWVEVVSEFNRRFRVPFTVKITNKSNFVLKDEAPNIEFEYTRGTGDSKESTVLHKEDLMVSLSMGERRALYLLYILFDLERIRKQAREGGDNTLLLQMIFLIPSIIKTNMQLSSTYVILLKQKESICLCLHIILISLEPLSTGVVLAGKTVT